MSPDFSDHPPAAPRATRAVSARVVRDVLVLPALPPRLLADWQRDLQTQLPLVPGDVGSLSLVRAKSRWPAYRSGVELVADWLAGQGIPGALDTAEVALMACRGAHCHHDGVQYGDAVFCNLFLSEDAGQDVYFPHIDLRVPLVFGTVLLFDTWQPHAVIDRQRGHFDAADFAQYPASAQIFLTWELPLTQTGVAQALGLSSAAQAGDWPNP